MEAAKPETKMPWFFAALANGIDSIENIMLKAENQNIIVYFKTESAPVSDLLELCDRLDDLGYTDLALRRREGSGPEYEFTKG